MWGVDPFKKILAQKLTELGCLDFGWRGSNCCDRAVRQVGSILWIWLGSEERFCCWQSSIDLVQLLVKFGSRTIKCRFARAATVTRFLPGRASKATNCVWLDQNCDRFMRDGSNSLLASDEQCNFLFLDPRVALKRIKLPSRWPRPCRARDQPMHGQAG